MNKPIVAYLETNQLRRKDISKMNMPTMWQWNDDDQQDGHERPGIMELKSCSENEGYN